MPILQKSTWPQRKPRIFRRPKKAKTATLFEQIQVNIGNSIYGFWNPGHLRRLEWEGLGKQGRSALVLATCPLQEGLFPSWGSRGGTSQGLWPKGGFWVPHAPEQGPELEQVHEQHQWPIAAEVAVDEEERELHQSTGHQGEEQRQRLPHAVPMGAVGAAQVERRYRLGHEQEQGR